MKQFRFANLLALCLVALVAFLQPYVPEASANVETCLISNEMAAHFIERFDAIFDDAPGPSLDIVDEIFAEDFVSYDLPLAPELDREGWKDYIASFYTGEINWDQEVNQVLLGVDRIMLQLTYTATYDGPLFGVPATGEHLTVKAISIFRFDEKCLAAEQWAVIDISGLLAQIGAFPPAE